MHDIIVIGASAGGIEACHQLLKLLPSDIRASIFIVVHVSPRSPSVLAQIFGRGVQLPVKNPTDGESMERGRVYVAPANHHLILKPGVIRLGRGPQEHGSRPSVDALFRTAAFAYGERVIGIILSGSLSDGTAGLMSIKASGGIAIVQKPEEATFPSMPRSALEFVRVDYVLGIADIAKELIKLTGNSAAKSHPEERIDKESYVHEFGAAGLREGMSGIPSYLTCPSCGGALWETNVDRFKEFKCHVGHSFTPETLLQQQADAIDTAFWRNLRRLEENIALRKKLASWAREENKGSEADRQEAQAELARRQADSIRQALLTDVASLSDPAELTD
jgi:two-component system chemotaxis response regulator CheB